MSDRMIELQRARMGLPPAGSVPLPSSMSRSASASRLRTQQPLPPQSEDEKLQAFLKMLQKRDDSQAHVVTAPTVPTSLSRRILQRQGVGYLDSTVATLVSASADRLLESLLLQTKECRDKRLMEKAVNTELHQTKRRKRQYLYTDASDDRERRKMRRLKEHLMNDSSFQGPAEEDRKQTAWNISSEHETVGHADTDNTEAANHDNGQLGESDSVSDVQSIQSDEDVREDPGDPGSTIALPDITHPLKLHGFGNLTGKIGLGPIDLETTDLPADPVAEKSQLPSFATNGTNGFDSMKDLFSSNNSHMN